MVCPAKTVSRIVLFYSSKEISRDPKHLHNSSPLCSTPPSPQPLNKSLNKCSLLYLSNMSPSTALVFAPDMHVPRCGFFFRQRQCQSNDFKKNKDFPQSRNNLSPQLQSGTTSKSWGYLGLCVKKLFFLHVRLNRTDPFLASNPPSSKER